MDKALPGQISFESLTEKKNIKDQQRLVKKIVADLEAVHCRLIFAVDGAKALRDAGLSGGEDLENIIKSCGLTLQALKYMRKDEQ